jgi:hypothetical protein
MKYLDLRSSDSRGRLSLHISFCNLRRCVGVIGQPGLRFLFAILLNRNESFLRDGERARRPLDSRRDAGAPVR